MWQKIKEWACIICLIPFVIISIIVMKYDDWKHGPISHPDDE